MPLFSNFIDVPGLIAFADGVNEGSINPVPDATVVATLKFAVRGVAVP